MANYTNERGPMGNPISIRVVELKDGWAGQVAVGREIVREQGGFATGEDADSWAVEQVTRAFKRLLAD